MVGDGGSDVVSRAVRQPPGAALSRVVTGRLAAALVLGAGLTGLPVVVLPHPATVDVAGQLAVSLFGVLAGIALLALPWQRWSAWTQLLVLTGPVSALLFGREAYLGPQDDIKAIFFVVVAAWIGIAQPRLTILWVMPLVSGLYLGQLAVDGLPVVSHIGFLAQVLAVCFMVAESLAWVAARLRGAERVAAARLGHMDALVEVATALAYDLEPVGVTSTVADLARVLLRASSSIVLLPGEDGLLVRERRGDDAVTGPPPAVRAGAVAAFGSRRLVAERRSRTWDLFVPLLGTAGALGVVELSDCRIRGVDPFTRSLAEAFSIQAGLALERTWSRARLVDTSMRDDLTGLKNRRWAMATLARIEPGDAVVMIDLDHFKQVNDTLGHGAGDGVLREFAAFLHESLRAEDDVARFGGEEFLVVMRTPGSQPRESVDRLRRRWMQRGPLVSFSAGMCIHQGGAPVSATLRQADVALYDAKGAGRNRVRVATGWRAAPVGSSDGDEGGAGGSAGAHLHASSRLGDPGGST